MLHSVSTPLHPTHNLAQPWRSPADSAPLMFWPQVWADDLDAGPDAGPDAAATALGQQLAHTLLATQGLYVFDRRARTTLFVSPGVERLLGYPVECFTQEFHSGLIHPDDLPIVTEATALANCYALEHRHECQHDLVLAVDYRLRHANGHWVRLLRQNFVLKCEEGGAAVAVGGLLTDISMHKHTNDVRFQMNRPGFADFVRRHRPDVPCLTVREQEILALVLDGLTSGQIADRLHISPATVDTHRRNLRHKTQSGSLHCLLSHLDTA